MDAKTCILTRRSHRKFTDQPVSHAQIEEIVSLAAYAPSWKNTQISRYIAIESDQLKREIAERFCLPGSNNPAIIIADQPTRGIDVGATEFIRRKLVELSRNGAAVLLVSADLNEVMELSDSLIVMVGGALYFFVLPRTLQGQDRNI